MKGKNRATIMMVILLVLVQIMGGCSSKPNLDEVEKAINDGKISIDYAYEKGWITQEWIDENVESIPMIDKREHNLIQSFTTTTILGKEFKDTDVGQFTYIALINPEKENGEKQYRILVEFSEALKEKNFEVVIISDLENNEEFFKDCPYTVVELNDEVSEVFKNEIELYEELGYTASFNINKAFISSWQLQIEKEKFISQLEGFVDMVSGDKEEN